MLTLDFLTVFGLKLPPSCQKQEQKRSHQKIENEESYGHILQSRHKILAQTLIWIIDSFAILVIIVRISATFFC